MLKALGFTTVGLDAEAADFLETTQLPNPYAIVMGAEGKGLRELTRETCDRMVRIVTDGPITSLSFDAAPAAFSADQSIGFE